MKSTTLLLLGGLFLAGNALAGEPTPQNAGTNAGMKVGFDRATGKIRALSAEEIAALDAMEAAAPSATMAKGARGKTANGATFKAASGFPETEEESLATQRVVNGFLIQQPPASLLSTMTVKRNPDGTLLVEEGESSDAQHQEAASE